jgi:hypothetical protein
VRFAGVSLEQWTAVLADAARVGLLTSLGAGMYRIHPALPGYLAAGWQAQDPSGYGAPSISLANPGAATQMQGAAEDVIWTAYLSFRMSSAQLLVICGAALLLVPRR